jgi:hypothetical protein
MSKRNEVISLRFFLRGREVTRANWHKFRPEVSEDRLDAIAQPVFDAIGPLKCAEHSKKADIEAAGESWSELQFRVTACCEAFRAEVTRALETVRPTSGGSQ